MKCVIYKHGETEPGYATVALENAGATLVIKKAQVCQTCAEEPLNQSVTTELYARAQRAAQSAVQVDGRDYVAA